MRFVNPQPPYWTQLLAKIQQMRLPYAIILSAYKAELLLLIKLVCLYKQENKPDVENFALQSSAKVWKQANTLIMSRMIPDSLKNIRFKFRKEAQKTLDLDSCLKVLLHPNFKTPISVVSGIQSCNFAKRWAIWWQKNLLGLHCKRGTQMWEMSFTFSARPPFFHFLESRWLWHIA